MSSRRRLGVRGNNKETEMARKRHSDKGHHRPDKKYVEKTRSQTSSGEWWKPDAKHKNQIRVMPAWDDRGICIVRRVMHFGFEEGGRNRAFPCLEDNEPWMDSIPCPVDHVIAKMVKGDKDERSAASDLKASSARFLVQIVDCNDIEAGVQKWAGPLSFGKYFLSLLEDDDIEDITDPEDGYDIYFEMSGSGRGTKYDYRLRAKSSPIAYDDWEEDLDDLLETIEIRDTEELIELLVENYGNAFDIKEYLEDFEGETEKKGKKKKKAREKDEEDEEKTPAQKRKARRAAKAAAEEEEKKKVEEPGEEEWTAEEILAMNKRKLLKVVKDEELPIEDEDWDSAKELRELIMDELNIKEEDVPF